MLCLLFVKRHPPPPCHVPRNLSLSRNPGQPLPKKRTRRNCHPAWTCPLLPLWDYFVCYFFSLSAAHCVLSLSVIGQSVKTVLTGSTFQRLSGYTSVSGFVAFSPFEEEPSEGLQRNLVCKNKKKKRLIRQVASPSCRYLLRGIIKLRLLQEPVDVYLHAIAKSCNYKKFIP